MAPFFAAKMLCLSVSVVGGSALIHARTPQNQPVVTGIVIDSMGQPIAFAQVRGPGVDPRTSDDSGRFRFTMRKRGSLSLTVRRVGFQPLETTLRVDSDTTLELVMRPLAASLATVRVEAEATVRTLEMRGFYDRLRDHVKGTNTGWFIMPEEIEGRRGAIKATQLLQGIPNLRVMKISPGKDNPTGQWFETLVGPGGCPMTIYLDGARLNKLGGESLRWQISTGCSRRATWPESRFIRTPTCPEPSNPSP